MSAHVYGLAIDLNVDWSKLNGPWSSDAKKVVKQFGLKRPFFDEPWHVEIDKKVKLQ